MEKEKIILPGLEALDYEHKGERELQATLNKNKMIERAFAMISEYGVERMVLLQHIGSDIEVKETNLPQLKKILNEICETLSIKTIPRMYLNQDPSINASALGINNPIIVVNTGTLEKLSMDELYFIIGHEAGHIKSKHTRYGFLQMILPFLGNLVPAVGPLISVGIQVLLFRFQRMAEFTADRAGMLCCQNLDTATTSLMKLAGYPMQYYDQINKDDFIKQFDDFKDYNENTYNKALNLIANMQMTHPWSVLRGKELFQWVNDNKYEELLSKYGNNNDKNFKKGFCVNCGKELVPGKFCPHCGEQYDGTPWN
jgi:Zn-dependent protease with chaperone function